MAPPRAPDRVDFRGFPLDRPAPRHDRAPTATARRTGRQDRPAGRSRQGNRV